MTSPLDAPPTPVDDYSTALTYLDWITQDADRLHEICNRDPQSVADFIKQNTSVLRANLQDDGKGKITANLDGDSSTQTVLTNVKCTLRNIQRRPARAYRLAVPILKVTRDYFEDELEDDSLEQRRERDVPKGQDLLSSPLEPGEEELWVPQKNKQTVQQATPEVTPAPQPSEPRKRVAESALEKAEKRVQEPGPKALENPLRAGKRTIFFAEGESSDPYERWRTTAGSIKARRIAFLIRLELATPETRDEEFCAIWNKNWENKDFQRVFKENF
jgi:hypothetical protein